MIALTGVGRAFRTAGEIVPALRGIDLEIPRGQLVALLGPSGSGKTTLLGIVGGLDRPDVGEVCVGGVDVAQLSGAALSEYRLRSVGFVFQAAGLIPLMTALENVALPVQLMGRDDQGARELALDALELVGLEARVRHRAYELSGGEQQRVALARALVKQPKVLLADEPTGQLDSETSAAIVELIATLRGKTTILLATHDEAVAAHADRTIHMEDGALS
ncbi:MAG TPA: ABC transporter ATP-binding protein [Candidatus Dormibacteraeota bacterium]|nr:ABC transporter ATP-binding protein [Candidatus Dormibacteraeota bacterium]HEX2681733.1 ABC transporter ATP-binding protein [Candidatus Dormibacteraeota bacterium]